MAFLDATVVNIALPSIGEDLDASLSGLQWTVNAYALTLAGLILIGGSLGDHYGRRRVFVIGVIWFAVASLLCAVAPTTAALIAARAVQGVGAALLTPGSLAILEAVFRPDDRGSAIGAWSGLAGVSTAVGPFLGGWFVEAVSWRLIFLINLPLAAVVVWAARAIPETSNPQVRGQRLDIAGAALTALGLAGVTFALTEGEARGWTDPTVVVLGVLGVAALCGFLAVEARGSHPMVPLDIFRNRVFSAANAVTFIVYAALAGALFLLPIQLQVVAGYSPIEAGSALVPMTIVMLLLSAQGRAPGSAHRAAPADGPGADHRRRRAGPADARRPGRLVRRRRPAGGARLRAGAVRHGGAAQRHGAGLGRRGAGGHRVGHQQRRRTGGGADRGGRDPPGGGDLGR